MVFTMDVDDFNISQSLTDNVNSYISVMCEFLAVVCILLTMCVLILGC